MDIMNENTRISPFFLVVVVEESKAIEKLNSFFSQA